MSAHPRPSGRALVRRWLSRFAKAGVSVAAIALVARGLDLGQMARVLAAADRTDVVVVSLVYLLGQAMTAWRWQVIAARVGFGEPLVDFVRHYYVGMFFNLFGPSTLGGDVVRALFLGAPAGRRAVALHTVFFDRLSGLVMLVFVAMAAIALFGRFELPWPVIALVSVSGAGLALGWFLVPPLARRFLPAGGRLNRLIEHDLGPFWKDGALLARTATISAAFHVMQAGSLVLLGHAVGLAVDWRYYFIFHPIVSVLSAIPVSVAGLGIREAGYVWFLQRQGVPADTAMAFGVLWFVVLLAASLVGGAVYVAGGATVPTLRHRPGGDGGRAPKG